MGLIEATLLLLFATTIAVPWARRIGLPTEILLVIGSLVLSLLPGLPPLILDPVVVFKLFLPPILFFGGAITSWRDFKRNQRAIFLLAFCLVLFTATLVAVAIRALGLGVSWPTAFLLGAIVSPPDASAATAIIKKLGVPRRLLTIIEGESLVNDATALVAYRFALGAIVTGSFSFGTAAMQFVVVSVGGVVIGLFVSMIALFILQRLHDSTAETTLTLITAFGAYLFGETLGFSGVISAVVAGSYFGRKLPTLPGAQTRLDALAFWKTVLFIINSLAFALIGLQMPAVLKGLQEYSWNQLIGYAATIVFVVMAVRFVWIFPAAYLPRKLFRSIARQDPLPGWRALTTLSWVGMRGIVSLAAALSVPLTLPSGAEFPFRNLLVFLTYIVVLATLLIPAITLPWLMRRLGIKDRGENRHDEIVARLALSGAVLREIELLKQSSTFSKDLLEDTARHFKSRVEDTRGPADLSPASTEGYNVRQLTRRVLKAARTELERLRKEATIHDAVFFELNRELDIQETLLDAQQV
jgi:Na+/H+ antiporter